MLLDQVPDWMPEIRGDSFMSTGTQAGDVNLDIGAEGEFAVRFTDASAA